ncbi:MAG: PD40 domain-containing protein, partial [Anaerolineae bacterium]
MKRVISLLNIVLVLGLVVTASAPPVPLTAQGLGGVVDDGSGAARAPSPPDGEAPALEKKASAQALPSYMELVFASNSGGTWDIWNDTIQDIRLLTSDPVGAHTPRAAPGGGRVAFVSDRDGNPEIYVVDYDKTNERRLTYNEHAEWHPSWSHSGNRLVFSSDRDGDDHEIYIMDVDGSYVTRLTYNDDWDSWPVYSPDGTEIIFTTLSPLGDYDIWIMNADGSQQRALIANPAVDEYLPAWFPDGTEIAFTMWDPLVGDDEIWKFTLASGLMANLTNNPTSNDWAPVVSPDGAWIAFFSDRTVDDEVWVMPSVGGAGNETNISSDPVADDRFPDFSWARMSVRSGAWEQASTWIPNGVPSQRDRVLIRNGDRVTITSGAKKVVRQLQ